MSWFLCGGMHAQAQGYELRCRGGKDAFAIDKLDAKTLSLNFTVSQSAARFDGSGLIPGTCSWIDRVVNDNEPRQIQFILSASQAAAIPAHLNDPNKFWSFFVLNTNRGYFEAKSHSAWQPGASGPAPAPAAPGNTQRPSQAERVGKPQGNSAAAILPKNEKNDRGIVEPTHRGEDVRLPAIFDLKVSPTLNGAMFTFIARPGPTPVVEIDKKVPFKDSLRRASFNPPLLRFNPAVMKNKSTQTGTAYAGGSYLANIKLDQGTVYHYIITVPAEGSAPYQQTGSFKTSSRIVKVYFTQIYILDDSDNDTSGDLFFRLHVDAGPSRVATRSMGSDLDKLQWESGHKERFREPFPLVVDKAGDRLRIWVEGTDDDSLTGCYIAANTEPAAFFYENLRPHKKPSCDDEVNYARGEFDLSKYPGKFVNIPFTLQSMPLGPSGVRLMFDVSGYIEFTNPDIP